jgi:hypothetical protein
MRHHRIAHIPDGFDEKPSIKPIHAQRLEMP